MIEVALLNSLREEQQQYALQSLKQPNRCDAFEYGYRTGIIAGYEQAIALLLKMIDEERNGERDL